MKLKFDDKALVRGGVFAIAAIIIAVFMPRSGTVRYNYEMNRPWEYPLLQAPFNILVYHDDATQQRLTDSINASIIPIFKFDSTPKTKAREAVLANTDLTDAQRQFTVNVIDGLFADGIVEAEIADRVRSGNLTDIKVHDNNSSQTLSTSKMRSQRAAYQRLDTIVSAHYGDIMPALRKMRIDNYLQPNIIINEQETELLRNELLSPVVAAQYEIQQNEKIVDRGEIVTPQIYQALKSYEKMQAEMDAAGGSNINIAIGQLAFAFICMSILGSYLYFYRRKTLYDMRRVICLLSLLVGFFVLGVFMNSVFSSGLYIVPFAILPIVVVVFFDSSMALFMMLMGVITCASFANFPFEFVFVEVVAGLTAIFSTKELSKRSQLLRTSAYVCLAYILSYCAVELMQEATLRSFSWKLIGFFAVNMVLTSFAYILIFVIEKLFGFTSVVTLVELSDINNPLLRDLSVECPGTFQHSLAVSNLVADAAREVGANVQLVRAGALYHDIGKIKNPAFFTENQHGVNPHDALSPIQSARIIIGHVTDGLKRAEKENLPRVIRDMISQHHGNGQAKYFYTTYSNQHPDEDVDPAPFTYPGPNPQSKEASLLMMADAVEAASRSLPDHSPEKIEALVNRLIDGQVAAGLHKDSPLSFQDITTIKKSFIKALRTMYHVRIAYPEAKKKS
ncbi:MAG: HDIG domain-containing protein [Muribaculaceae bacterium]|nr:HDIG domain-containing protein [Muribaculaceae bacterium]